MRITDLFEYNAWHGPDDQWYSQGSDPWYNGDDQWHGENSGDMMEEDFAAGNLVTFEGTGLSDVITARDLINAAVRDPQNEKHKYFEFLQFLRKKHGSEYSTDIHQRAAKLARAKD